MASLNPIIDQCRVLAKELRKQDNCGTRTPIGHFIQVNKRKTCEGEDYAGVGAVKVYYYDTEIYTRREIIRHIKENPEGFGTSWRDVNKLFDEDFDDFIVGGCNYTPLWQWYEYEDYLDCGVFLTRKAANKFARENLHHVGKDYRIYVRYFWRNQEVANLVNIITDIAKLRKVK